MSRKKFIMLISHILWARSTLEMSMMTTSNLKLDYIDINIRYWPDKCEPFLGA